MEFHASIFFITGVIGTIAFASSDVMVAIKQQLDLLGMVVPGVTTAVGSEMMWDIILGSVPPNLFMNPVYALTAFIAVLVLFIVVRLGQKILESRYIAAHEKMVNTLDAIGLAILTVTGIDIVVLAGYKDYHFLSMLLGVLTGVEGGVLRDIMAGQTPYILRKYVYASASIAGALCYMFLSDWLTGDASMIVNAPVVILIRLLTTRCRWNLLTATRKQK